MNIKNKTNLVISGSWNLGILIPEWFLKEFSWKSPPKQVPVELALGSNNIRFNIEDILIQPTQNQLNLIAEREDITIYEKICSLANNVYNKLPYTPIKAIGHNYAIVLDQGKTFKKLENLDIDQMQEYYKESANSSAVNTIKIDHKIEYSDHFLNLVYTIGRKEKYLNFNFHYDIVPTSKIPDIINNFSDNIKRAKTIAAKIIVKE